MTGPIAKEISEEFDVDPRRSASLRYVYICIPGYHSIRSTASVSSNTDRIDTASDYSESVLSASYGSMRSFGNHLPTTE